MENLSTLSKELMELSRKEGIKISNKKITKEINIAINNTLIIGNKVSSNFSIYFDDEILNDENIEDIAHDIAVERGEYKNFGISFYKKEENFNYIFSASNDKFQITLKNNIDLELII